MNKAHLYSYEMITVISWMRHSYCNLSLEYVSLIVLRILTDLRDPYPPPILESVQLSSSSCARGEKANSSRFGSNSTHGFKTNIKSRSNIALILTLQWTLLRPPIPFTNERVSVYLDKHNRMSLDTYDYFVKQISHGRGYCTFSVMSNPVSPGSVLYRVNRQTGTGLQSNPQWDLGSSKTFIIMKAHLLLNLFVELIWEKRNAPGNITYMGKIASSVLWKLFINGNESCHALTPPSAWEELYFQMLTYIPWSHRTRQI